MGIDIYLKWEDMDDETEKKQFCGFATTAGNVGYLREAYHGGPYATKILVREAFEAENCEAQIPAAVLRERLTNVTEPVLGKNGGHIAAAMLMDFMRQAGHEVTEEIADGITQPMSVEEACRLRCRKLYPEDGKEYEDAIVKSFRDFVELAEQKEKETGKPCTIIASY